MTRNENAKVPFLRMYSVDFSDALHTIDVLNRYQHLEVRIPLIRDIVVTYARPFSGNKGEGIRDTLPVKDHVPKKFRNLHHELMQLRMNQFAHTDLRYYKPRISRSPVGNGYMSFKGYEYPKLIARVSEIRELISSVEESVRVQIKKINGAQ